MYIRKLTGESMTGTLTGGLGDRGGVEARDCLTPLRPPSAVLRGVIFIQAFA